MPKLTVADLRNILDQFSDEDIVCFLLQQTHNNLQYELRGAGYAMPDEDDDPNEVEEERRLYLVGREDGYGPSEIDQV